MMQRSRIAALAVPILMSAGGGFAQGSGSEQPRIINVQAVPEDGRTTVKIETSSESISYISYSRDQRTYVVDLYGVDASDVPAFLPVGTPEIESVELQWSDSDRGSSSAVARFVIERKTAGTTQVLVRGSTIVVEARTGAAVRAVAPHAAVPQSRLSPAAPSREGSSPISAATDISEIRAEVAGDALAITIRGDGKLRYDSFLLENPPRLVIDLPGIDNHVVRRAIEVGHGVVERIRVAQYRGEPDRVTRVVLDLRSVEAHQITTAGRELRVVFGDYPSAVSEGPTDDSQAPLFEAAQGVPPAPPSPRPVDASRSFEPSVVGSSSDDEGTLISLDLKDADIKDVLRYFSEISGLNIILDPGVVGTVTVRLIDVPWNKALDIILKAHGFGKTLDGNVLRIAEVSKLTVEESLAAELRKQQEEARPLISITRQISYADAQQIANIVKETALSSKGSIIIDQRTNTLVITEVDIPSYRERIITLIKSLDTPTPQVEIEARIVETTKSFSKSIGIQWGFNQTYDQTTGSTTDFSFPNNGVVSGDLVRGTGGFTSRLPGGGWAVNLPGSGANAAIGFQLASITDQFQLDTVLSALEDEGKGRVLSAPKITTQSNIPASIESGLSIPIQTVANNTITVQYIPASLRLNVTPQVTADGTIILNVIVDQSSPDLGVAVGSSALPPITTRKAQTTLLVPDGGTAVIGGVFQINENETQNRIPALSRIPILGWLFRNHTQRRTNNELLIFITPKIKSLG